MNTENPRKLKRGTRAILYTCTFSRESSGGTFQLHLEFDSRSVCRAPAWFEARVIHMGPVLGNSPNIPASKPLPDPGIRGWESWATSTPNLINPLCIRTPTSWVVACFTPAAFYGSSGAFVANKVIFNLQLNVLSARSRVSRCTAVQPVSVVILKVRNK